MQFNRRSFLKSGIAATTAAIWYQNTSSDIYADSQVMLDVGVASGEPHPDNVLIWTRIPEWAQPKGASSEIEVFYEVSQTPRFSNPAELVEKGSVFTNQDVDFTVKINVTNLQSGTTYYYRFYTNTGYFSVVGRTKTAYAPGQEPEEISFAFVSCQKFTEGYYNVYKHLLEEDVDFCIHLGDTVYENGESGFGVKTVRRDNVNRGKNVHTLQDYRLKHRHYLTDPFWKAVRARFPWIIMWDDHEVFNDYSGPETFRKDRNTLSNGYRSFCEYMPVRRFLESTSQGVRVNNSFGSYRYGDLFELIAMDQRQFRDSLGCGKSMFAAKCDEHYTPKRSLLGQEQLSWVKNSLANSSCQWKFLLSELMMGQFRITRKMWDNIKGLNPFSFDQQEIEKAGDIFFALDGWDGYPEERTKLLQFFGEEKISNVVVLTGDIHNYYMHELRPDFSSPTQKATALEFVGASVSTAGVLDSVHIDPRILLGESLQSFNPHLRFLDFKHHGYTKVIASKSKLKVEFIAVDTVHSPTSKKFVLQEFQVPNGHSQVLVK